MMAWWPGDDLKILNQGKFQGLPIAGPPFLYYSHKNPFDSYGNGMGPAEMGRGFSRFCGGRKEEVP